MKKLMSLFLILIFLAVPVFAESNVTNKSSKYCNANVRIIEDKIPEESYLKFDIILTNYKEYEENVKVNYYVEDISGKKWFKKDEDIFLNALSTRTFKMEVPIYPGQKPGKYYLKGVILCGFDEINFEKPFTIIPAENKLQKLKNVEIKGIKGEIYLVNEEERLFEIKVKNNGSQPLHNVFLDVMGIPSSWYKTSERIDIFNPQEEKAFNLTIFPQATSEMEFTLTILLVTDEGKYEVPLSAKLFLSKEKAFDFISNKTQKILIKIQKISQEKERSEASQLLVKLSKAKTLEEVENLYFEAKRLLEEVEKERKQKFLIPINIEFFSYSYIFVIATIMISLFSIVFITKIFKKKKEKVEKYLKNVPRELPKLVHGKTTEITKEDLLLQKKRIEGVLQLLEKQYRQGILSKRAYNELKKKNEKKLREIERKLKKL